MTLDDWMERNGLTDAAVAAKLGKLSRSQVTRIRLGSNKPSAKIAVQLAKLTGIPSIDFMLGRAGNPRGRRKAEPASAPARQAKAA